MEKQFFLSLIGFFIFSFCFSQDTTQHVINAGAGEIISDEGDLIYYIGDFIQETDESLEFAALQEMVETEIVLFPNPTQSTLNIRSNLRDVSRYLLYDLGGTLKQEIKPDIKQVDLTEYAIGIYFLEVRDLEDRLMGTLKIIKN